MEEIPVRLTETLVVIVGIAVQLTVFSKTPIVQNCFTFFFATNTVYVCLLSGRTIAALFGRLLNPVSADRLFMTSYLVITVFFLITFYVETKIVIWSALRVYKQRLTNLLTFSVLLFAVLISATNALGAWELPNFFGIVLRNTFLIAMVISGYLLAFSALVNIGKQLESEAESVLSKEQLISSNKRDRRREGTL